MDYARRLLADRSRLLASRLSISRHRRLVSRPPVGERLRASISHRSPSTEAWHIRAYRARVSAAKFGQQVRERSWLVRAGCAAAAILLLVVVLSISNSTKPNVPLMTAAARPQSSAGPLPQTARKTGSGAVTGSKTSPGSTAHKSSHPLSAAGLATKAATPSNPVIPSTPAAAAPAHTVTVYQPTQPITVTRTTTTPHPASSRPTATSVTTKPVAKPLSTRSTTTTHTKQLRTTTTVSRPTGRLTPGVMTSTAYDALTVNESMMAAITRKFGSTATPAQLQRVFGANWLQTFLQYQIPGESCVYYLVKDVPQKSAIQLCFNSSKVLVNKQLIAVQPAGS